MIIAILDVETTGLDPVNDRIIESAVAAYWVESRVMLGMHCGLDPRVSTNAAAHINGISDEMLEAARGGPAVDPLILLRKWIEAGWITAVLAHNAGFDKNFVENSHAFRGITVAVPWICTYRDFTWGPKVSHQLAHLAVDNGVWLTPALAHRAHGDVLTLAALLTARDDLEDQIAAALLPRGLFQAIVSFQQKDLAKDRGFTWNGTAKRWEKRLPLDAHLGPTTDRPFRIARVPE